MSKKVRLYLIIGAAAAVLLATGVVVVVNVLGSTVDDAIPQADLFGTTAAPARPDLAAAPQPDPAAGRGHQGTAEHPYRGRGHPRGAPGPGSPHADAVMILHVNKDLSAPT